MGICGLLAGFFAVSGPDQPAHPAAGLAGNALLADQGVPTVLVCADAADGEGHRDWLFLPFWEG